MPSIQKIVVASTLAYITYLVAKCPCPTLVCCSRPKVYGSAIFAFAILEYGEFLNQLVSTA